MYIVVCKLSPTDRHAATQLFLSISSSHIVLVCCVCQCFGVCVCVCVSERKRKKEKKKSVLGRFWFEFNTFISKMPRPGPRPYECVRRAWHSERHQPVRGSIIQQIFRFWVLLVSPPPPLFLALVHSSDSIARHVFD